jgi:hypothetical protein
MSQSPDTPEARKPLRAKKKQMSLTAQAFLFALAFYGIGALLFFILYGMEQSGSGATVAWWLACLYMLGGKWLVAGVFGVLGTLFLAGALLTLFVKPKE